MSSKTNQENSGIYKQRQCYTPLDTAYKYTCFNKNNYYKGINNPTSSCLCTVPEERSSFDKALIQGKTWPKGNQTFGWREY